MHDRPLTGYIQQYEDFHCQDMSLIYKSKDINIIFGEFEILHFSETYTVQITSKPVAGFKISSSVGINKVSTLLIQDYTVALLLI